jgi:asparagine synthase (glutamine-hydrolysing)
MSGIAGVAARDRAADVIEMLEALSHRGRQGIQVFEAGDATLGAVAAAGKAPAWDAALGLVQDECGPGRFACARSGPGRLELRRDPLGAAPLYLGRTRDGALAFASEVRALLRVARDVRELPPGSRWADGRIQPGRPLALVPGRQDHPRQLAWELRTCLEAAVVRALARGGAGAWLSGGLDSSTLAALAQRNGARLHTFAGGLDGAGDLRFAREAADYLGTRHHQVTLTAARLKVVLPAVVASLESFDALLVRASVVNHLVAEVAADYVDAVFSGEGGDELFAGHAYLRELPIEQLPAELLDLASRLHNTALQRVDRSAARFGLAVHTCFLDPEVVALALAIPAEYKIRAGVEKWILREAMEGLLPAGVLARPKTRFWEGAGVESLLAELAEDEVSDDDFRRERRLANGWLLDSKEELLNYRYFRERFGDLRDLDWMGRTKDRPRAEAVG